jgi:putative transposase
MRCAGDTNCSHRTNLSSEVFEYIEGFYNPVRRHKYLDQLSPLELERRQIAL